MLWVSMGVYGFLLVHGIYGFPWVYIGVYGYL